MSRTQLIAIAVMGCLSLAAVGQAAETIHFREGGGSGYTDVTFDDTWVRYSPADDNTHGNDSYHGIHAADAADASLIAIKDLFTELPLTSGGCDIQINSATLHLFRYQGSSSTTVSLYRVTTNWLPDPAGSNENDVSGEHAEKSQSTDWASGDFSASDYDTSVVCTGAWGDGYNEELTYDVADIIADIYDNETNYGMALLADGTIYGRASEHATHPPSLEITYEYVSSGYRHSRRHFVIDHTDHAGGQPGDHGHLHGQEVDTGGQQWDRRRELRGRYCGSYLGRYSTFRSGV